VHISVHCRSLAQNNRQCIVDKSWWRCTGCNVVDTLQRNINHCTSHCVLCINNIIIKFIDIIDMGLISLKKVNFEIYIADRKATTCI